MDQDIQTHLKTCQKCQLRRTRDQTKPAILSPLPQCTQTNQRIHADLFGFLFVSGRGKKYILCITDVFTKYVELVAIDNKEAATVAEAIFEKWFCRYGIPMEIVTDGGKEFCAKVSEEVIKRMGATHLKTAPYHPQCNSQAEVANKTIADYLSKYINQTTLEWEFYIAPLMFAYNTSFHCSIQNMPHFLTFGIQASQPAFFQEDLNRKFYGENTTDKLTQRLQYARQIAEQNNKYATSKMQEQFNRMAQPHSFAPNQWVLLRDFTVLGKNAKLAPKWKGPFKIISLKGAHNLLIHLADRKKTELVNIENVKPYHEAPENRCTIWRDLKETKIQRTSRRKWGQRGLIMFSLKKPRKNKILIKLTKPQSLTHFSKGGRD